MAFDFITFSKNVDTRLKAIDAPFTSVLVPLFNDTYGTTIPQNDDWNSKTRLPLLMAIQLDDAPNGVVSLEEISGFLNRLKHDVAEDKNQDLANISKNFALQLSAKIGQQSAIQVVRDIVDAMKEEKAKLVGITY